MRAFESSLRTVLLLGVGVAAFMGAFRAAPSAPPRPGLLPVVTPTPQFAPPALRAPAGEDPIGLLQQLDDDEALQAKLALPALEAPLDPWPDGAPERVLIIPLPADAAPDVLEFRRRTRQAVHRALLQGQWQLDSEETLRIGAFVPEGATNQARLLFETARRNASKDSVAVIVWVRYEDLGDQALASVRNIGERFHDSTSGDAKPRLFLIGPAYSDHLIELTREAGTVLDAATEEIVLLSPWATVDPWRILQAAGVQVPQEQGEAALADRFRAARVHWQPTVLSDAVLMSLLKAELTARVPLDLRVERTRPDTTDSPDEPFRPIRLLLITEAGTSYGRFWAHAPSWTGPGSALPADAVSVGTAEPADFEVVDRFTFQRGLDGGGQQTAGSALGVEPSGALQLDYLLRTFADVEHMHRAYPSLDEPHAIGVFATDAYDKLLLIRLLNDAFPRALLFTSDYDERLMLASELPHTRGLILASQYGPGGDVEFGRDVESLSANWRWRDWVQESTFEAARIGLGRAPADVGGCDHLRLYEIGSRGAVPLQFCADGSELSPPFRADRKEALGFFAFLAALLLALVAAMTWRLHWSIGHPVPMPGVDPRRAGVCLLVLAILSCALTAFGFRSIFLAAERPFEEPVTLFDGVSVWPAVAARLFAIPLLSFGFFIAWRNARLGRLEVAHARIARRAAACALLYLAFLAWVHSFGGAGVAPARGAMARQWMLGSTVASVVLIVGLVAYAGFLAVAGWREMRKFRQSHLVGLEEQAPGWSRGFGESLDRIGRMAARLTAITWIPATAMALTFFSRWRAIDDFSWPFWTVIQVLIPLLGLLAALAMIRIEAMMIRNKLTAAFQLRACTHPPGREQPDDVRRASEYLTAYKRGPFGPLSEDPLVLSLLIPLAVFGSGGWLESLSVFSAR
jgi:hypothetical protein